MIELFEKFPALKEIPHHPIGDFPTPLTLMPALAQAAEIEELWIKRDDISSAVYGGNKVRKLEFLLADAINRGANRVWTVGAIGSHHVLATSIYAKQAGLSVDVQHFPQPMTEHVRNNCLAVAATGANLRLGGVVSLVLTVLGKKLHHSKTTYPIPAGGSSPVGALGYVNGALEIARQIQEKNIKPFHAIYVAVGSCGTLAGLVVGFRLARLPIRLIGVRVVDKVIVNRRSIDRLIRGTVKIIQSYGVNVPTNVDVAYQLEHGQFGDGYGHPTESALAAISLAKKEGISLEQTYTGKTFAGLLATAKPHGFRRVAFIDTFNSQSKDGLIPEGFGPDDLPEKYAKYFS